MPRKYISKSKKHWTQQAVQDALAEHQTAGTSIRKLSQKYNIPKSTLNDYMKKDIKVQGRKPVFTDEEINDLVETINTLADLGFGMTMRDIGELVFSYVEANDHQRAKKIFNYGGRCGYPGPDWIKDSLMKKGNLSAKQATTLSNARYAATKNPFVINHFYDMLEKTIDELGLSERPDLIWNCDESGLPHEPSKLKIISKVGGNTLLVNPGADRENTTVMAACSAAGRYLPPMIVFEGQFVQTTWRPNISKSADYPWLYANTSGWMTSDTFYKWFEEWEKATRSFNDDGELEKRLLIYDGHLSHIWYGTLEYARAQSVTIIKLPPHTTDVLQPLDVSVFRSLKVHWGDILFKRLRCTRSRLTKAEFASNLCDNDVWKKSLSESNIKNGFKTCGIYPVDRSRYPDSRFSVTLKNRYIKWVEEGKPKLTAAELDEMIDESRQSEQRKADRIEPEAPSSSNTNAESVVINGRKGKVVSFFVPDENPSALERIDSTLPSPISSSTPKNFKAMALKKLDELQANKPSTSQQGKRKRVNPMGDIVTSDESFTEIMDEMKKKEEEEKAKKARKEEKKAAAGKGKGKKSVEKNNVDKESTVPNVVPEFTDSDEDSNDEYDFLKEDNTKKQPLFPPQNKSDAFEYLIEVWDDLNPPNEESEIVGKYFGVIYYDAEKKKPHFYIGKVFNRFLFDEGGPTEKLKVKVFKPALTSTSTVLEETPEHDQDIDDYPIYNVICGPIKVTLVRGSKWSAPEYPMAFKTFQVVKGLDRKAEYERLYPKLD